MRQITFIALPLVFLAACATPQQRCVAGASKDLRVVRALIVETQGNLDRGYAIGQEIRPKFTMGFCGRNGPLTTCLTQDASVIDKPVAIDLAAEREKLASLRAKERELAARAVTAAQQCETDYS